MVFVLSLFSIGVHLLCAIYRLQFFLPWLSTIPLEKHGLFIRRNTIGNFKDYLFINVAMEVAVFYDWEVILVGKVFVVLCLLQAFACD